MTSSFRPAGWRMTTRSRRAVLAALAVPACLATLMVAGVASAAPSPADLVGGVTADPG